MSLPAPENYNDWQSYARALVTALAEGNGDVVSNDRAVVSGGGGTGTGTTPLPAGYRSLWFNEATAALYLGNNAFDPPTAAALFQVNSGQLADVAVTFNKIAAGAVGFENLITNSVYGTVIKDAAIVSAKIADAAVLSAKIGDLQVVNAKIADLAVNSAKIANLAVTSAKIANLAVGSANIQFGAVGNLQIADQINSAAWNPATGDGWMIDRLGNISGKSLTLYSAAGNTMSASQVFTRFDNVESRTLLAARAGQGSITDNPGFLDLTGDSYPTATGWQHWFQTPTAAYRSTGQVGQWSWVINAALNWTTGIATSVAKPLRAGYYVIEAIWELFDGGTVNGAGIHLSGQNLGGAEVQTIALPLSTLKDSDNKTFADGTPYRLMRTQKLVQFTNVDLAKLAITGMVNWAGFGQGQPYKQLAWHYIGIRVATAAEIRDQTVLGPLEATVVTQGLVVATHDLRLATYLNRVSAGAGVAEVELIALDAGGLTTSAINLRAAKITLGGMAAPVLTVVAGKATFGSDVYVTNGQLVVDTGTHMKVIGNGFGSAGQFVEWFGPKMAFNLCTENNGNAWLKKNGSAYFGGVLSVGILRNAVQTTAISAAAEVTTGVFGSNGGPRVVGVSYAFASSQVITGACPVPPPMTVSIDIYRGTNAAGTYLTTLNVASGEWSCAPGFGPTEPGLWQASASGSLTYTDNTGGLSSSYFARIVSRDMPLGDTRTQSLSLGSSEG